MSDRSFFTFFCLLLYAHVFLYSIEHTFKICILRFLSANSTSLPFYGLFCWFIFLLIWVIFFSFMPGNLLLAVGHLTLLSAGFCHSFEGCVILL